MNLSSVLFPTCTVALLITGLTGTFSKNCSTSLPYLAFKFTVVLICMAAGSDYLELEPALMYSPSLEQYCLVLDPAQARLSPRVSLRVTCILELHSITQADHDRVKLHLTHNNLEITQNLPRYTLRRSAGHRLELDIVNFSHEDTGNYECTAGFSNTRLPVAQNMTAVLLNSSHTPCVQDHLLKSSSSSTTSRPKSKPDSSRISIFAALNSIPYHPYSSIPSSTSTSEQVYI